MPPMTAPMVEKNLRVGSTVFKSWCCGFFSVEMCSCGNNCLILASRVSNSMTCWVRRSISFSKRVLGLFSDDGDGVVLIFFGL